MKHILMVGPKLPATDGMIFAGSQYLFNQSNVSINEYVAIDDNSFNPISSHKSPTHIVVLGTPWLWDNCWKSYKYLNLQYLLNKYPNAKRLFLGVGSCYPLGKEETVKLDLVVNKTHLDIFKDSTVIVRDVLAHNTLKHCGIEATLLPCPAYFALKPSNGFYNSIPTMFWYDPTLGISKVDYKPNSELLERYTVKFQTFYRDYKPAVYCISAEEAQRALYLGFNNVKVIQDISHAELIIQNAYNIYSGRVHLGVPGFLLGKDIHIEPVDSRATVYSDVIQGLIKPPSHSVDTYIKIIRQIFA